MRAISSKSVLQTFYTDFKFSKNPKINEFDLVQDLPLLNSDHEFLNQKNCQQVSNVLVCYIKDTIYVKNFDKKTNGNIEF